VRIDLSIRKGELAKQENIVKAFSAAKEGNGRLHLLGLVSDGGVHSHINHLLALIAAAKDAGVPETYVHFFGDGRDTDPKSGAGYMKTLLDKFNELKYGKLGTVVGRYYAMDRDKRWERVQIAVDALTQGKGEQGTDDPVADIKAKYEKKETDEFLKPIVYNGDEARIKGTLVMGVDNRQGFLDFLQLPLRSCSRDCPDSLRRLLSTRRKSQNPIRFILDYHVEI
jgi:2,3-bisphosphoglycerate-independent phosphoglycerate mutase